MLDKRKCKTANRLSATLNANLETKETKTNMNNLIFKDNNIRTNGDMVCLTDMAKPYGKRVNNWSQLDSSQAYLEALSAVTGIPVSLLIESSDSGTFAHQALCDNLPDESRLT
jgi:hypothetical protein